MNMIKHTFLAMLLFTTVAATAQNKNPYKSIGKKGEILTLTKGRYEELFDQDSIQQIGSVLINVRTLKIIKFVDEENDIKERLQTEKQSRFLSVDPLTRSYPMLTPYQYASNTPIAAIDLDGLEGVVASPLGNQNVVSIETASRAATTIKAAAFKATFSNYLPKKFIDHYANGQGTPYKLSNKEAEDLHVLPTGIHGGSTNDIKKTDDFISKIKPGSSMELPEGFSIQGAAANAGTLGRFQINLKGSITKDKKDPSKWSFKGQMQFSDTYDFETSPTKPGDLERNNWADDQTNFANRFLPGKGFEVTSEWINVEQINSDYLDWFKDKSSEVIQNKVTENKAATGEVKKTTRETN